MLRHIVKSFCREVVESEIRTANRHQLFGIFLLATVLIISPIIIFLVHNATSTIHIFSIYLADKEDELKMEKDKFVRLVHMTLPRNMAGMIINNESPSPERIETAIVYYSQLVDFQKIVNNTTAPDVSTMITLQLQICDSQNVDQ